VSLVGYAETEEHVDASHGNRTK